MVCHRKVGGTVHLVPPPLIEDPPAELPTPPSAACASFIVGKSSGSRGRDRCRAEAHQRVARVFSRSVVLPRTNASSSSPGLDLHSFACALYCLPHPLMFLICLLTLSLNLPHQFVNFLACLLLFLRSFLLLSLKLPLFSFSSYRFLSSSFGCHSSNVLI